MKSVAIGIREAKAQLSRLVREAQQGVEWVITDRGRPVAKLIPIESETRAAPEQLLRLERWGWVDPPARHVHPLPAPLPVPDGLAQTLLQRDRDG